MLCLPPPISTERRGSFPSASSSEQHYGGYMRPNRLRAFQIINQHACEVARSLRTTHWSGSSRWFTLESSNGVFFRLHPWGIAALAALDSNQSLRSRIHSYYFSRRLFYYHFG